jgi:hypothetical protein
MVWGSLLVLATYLLMPASPALAQDPGNDQSIQQPEQPIPEEIDSHVADMSDEQVRQAFKEKLKQDAAGWHDSGQVSAEEGLWNVVSARFYEAAQAAAAVFKRVESFLPKRARIRADGALPSPS